MKHFFQKAGRWALGAALLLGAGRAQAQLSAYTFTPSSGTFTALPASATNVPVLLQDDATSGTPLIQLGFPFVFDGISYTEVKACSNGFLSFNPAATYNVGNELATANAGTEKPLLAPLWDDLSGAGGRASYLTTGTAPNRVFTFEWLNWKWAYGAAAPSISFQVKLYEGSNAIEYVYRREAAAPSTGPSFGASIGLAGGVSGTASSAFLSLSNSSAAPTASSTVETNTITTAPATGQVYAFAPPAAGGCLGVRNLAVASFSATGATISYQSTAGTTGVAVTYQAAGGQPQTLTPAPGASPFALTGLTPNTAYTVTVTGQCGAASGPAQTVSFRTAPAVYCTAGLGGTCGAFNIAEVLLASSGLNATALTCTTTGAGDAYMAYPATAPTTGTVSRGGTYALSVTTAGNSIVSAWADWNQNYVLEAGEWVQVSLASGAGTPATVNLVVPTTAATGTTVLRIRSRQSGNTNGAADACTSFGTGETKDFVLTVAGPAACPSPSGLAVSGVSSTGATLAFQPVAGAAGTYTVLYGPAGFNPATGGTAITGANPSTTVTGLAPGTAYSFYVVLNCAGGPSQPAGPVSFSTPPVNDDPCNAVVLPLTGPCAPQTFSSVGATITTSPSASASACIGVNFTPKDVWFAVTTRASGPGSTSMRVNVTGNAAARVQMLRVNPTTGQGCAGPFIGVMCVGSAANTAAPVLDVPTGLTPGTTYYVRVHGANFNDPLGTFTICATAQGLLGSRAQAESAALTVYPNPASAGRFTLRLAEAGHPAGTATLLNALGQAVATRPVPANAAEVDFSPKALPAGLYSLRVALGAEVLTRKVEISW